MAWWVVVTNGSHVTFKQGLALICWRMTAAIFVSHSSESGLAAVVSRGYVSDVDDLDAAALLGVWADAVKVPDAAEDPLDGGRVVTNHVGGFRQMVTVPAHRKSQHTTVKVRGNCVGRKWCFDLAGVRWPADSCHLLPSIGGNMKCRLTFQVNRIKWTGCFGFGFILTSGCSSTSASSTSCLSF